MGFVYKAIGKYYTIAAIYEKMEEYLEYSKHFLDKALK